MPGKEIPEHANVGDELTVFIYRDSEDRLIATTREPLAKTGDLAYLNVSAKTKIGAFLDFGLERGLFLPFREQKYTLEIGKSYLVYVYVDKSGRLSCTTDIYERLSANGPYQKNDKVTGIVYSINPDIGFFVAVDNKYLGLIPKSEAYLDLNIGDSIEARVIRVRDDGKLDLSPRELSHKQMDDDAEVLLAAIRKNQGNLALDEKAPPEEIQRQFHMSKAAYKRAIGGLLKSNKIAKTDEGFKLLDLD